MANPTTSTPDVSTRKLTAMKLGELRAHARKLRIDGADELHKPELLARVKDHHYVSELSRMKLAELRAHARKLHIDGADELHKPELLAKVKDHHNAQAHGGNQREGRGGASAGRRPTARELSSMKLAELRAHARKLRIDGADELHKPELLAKVKHHHHARELSSMKLAELRAHARKLHIDGADELHKPELLAKVQDHHNAQAPGGKDHAGSDASARQDGITCWAEHDRDEKPTPATPDAGSTKPAAMKPDKLHTDTPEPGTDRADELHKPELPTKGTDAPNTTPDAHLSARKEEPHHGHHRLDDSTTTAQAGTTATPDDDRGRDTAGSSTDDAMARLQQRLPVSTQTREADRAQLRTPVTTEYQQRSAPMSGEERTAAHQPIIEANRDTTHHSPTIPQEQHEVMLGQDRPVVEDDAVPIESVLLGTDTRTEQETIGTPVPNEEIEPDEEGSNLRGR